MNKTIIRILSFLLVFTLLPLGTPSVQHTAGQTQHTQNSCLSPILNAAGINPQTITPEQEKAHYGITEIFRGAVGRTIAFFKQHRTLSTVALGILSLTLLLVSSATSSIALASPIDSFTAATGSVGVTTTLGTRLFNIISVISGVVGITAFGITIKKGFHLFKRRLFSANKDLKYTKMLLSEIFEDSMYGSTDETPENVLAYMGMVIDSIEPINQLRAAESFEQLEEMSKTLLRAMKTGKDTDATLRAKAVIAQLIVTSMGSIGAIGDLASGNPANKIEADENAFSNILHTLKYLSKKLNVQFVAMASEGTGDGSLSFQLKQSIGKPTASKLYLIVDPVEITNGMVKGRLHPNKRSNVLLSVVHIPEEKDDQVSYPPDKDDAYVRYANYGKWVSMGAERAEIEVSLTDTPSETMKKLLNSLNALSPYERSQYLQSRGVPLLESFREARPSDIVISGLWRERMRSRLRGFILEGFDVGPFRAIIQEGKDWHSFDLMEIARQAKENPGNIRIQYRFNKVFEKFIDTLNKTENGEKYVPTRGRAFGNLHLFDAGEAPTFFGASAGTVDYVEGQGGPAERFAVFVGHLIAGKRSLMECRFINKYATNNMAVFKKRIEDNIVPMAFQEQPMTNEQIRIALKKNPDSDDKTDILATDKQIEDIAKAIEKYKKLFNHATSRKTKELLPFNLRAEIMDVLLEDFSEIRLSKEQQEALKDVTITNKHTGGFDNPSFTVSEVFPTSFEELSEIGMAQAALFQGMICGPSTEAGDINEGEQVEIDLDNGIVSVSVNMWMMGQETPATVKMRFRMKHFDNPILEVKRLIRLGKFEEAGEMIERTFTPDLNPKFFETEGEEYTDPKEYIKKLRNFYLRFVAIKSMTMTTFDHGQNDKIAAMHEDLIIELLKFRGTDTFESPKKKRHIGFLIRHSVLELKGIYDIDVSKKLDQIEYSTQKLDAITKMESTGKIVPDMRLDQAIALRDFILSTQLIEAAA